MLSFDSFALSLVLSFRVIPCSKVMPAALKMSFISVPCALNTVRPLIPQIVLCHLSSPLLICFISSFVKVFAVFTLPSLSISLTCNVSAPYIVALKSACNEPLSPDVSSFTVNVFVRSAVDTLSIGSSAVRLRLRTILYDISPVFLPFTVSAFIDHCSAVSSFALPSAMIVTFSTASA